MARTTTPPEPPPLPSEGGSYVLVDGQWECVQRTVPPAGPAPEPLTSQDDAALHP